MDLIKSGSYIDIFYAKTCAITKISTVAGYHVVLATLLLNTVLRNFLKFEIGTKFFLQKLHRTLTHDHFTHSQF